LSGFAPSNVTCRQKQTQVSPITYVLGIQERWYSRVQVQTVQFSANHSDRDLDLASFERALRERLVFSR
jgi:hypothetical protein